MNHLHRLLFLVLLPSLLLPSLLLPSLLLAAEQEEKLSEGMVNPGYHDKPAWFKESFLDIREDLDEAASEGRRVLLYYYQDGCPYCDKLLQDNFGNRDLADYTQQHFDVIAINMWGDREVTGLDGQSTTEKAFSRGLKVQFTPTLQFLDEQGKVLLRVNGYFEPYKFKTAMQYVAERKENSLSIRDYFRQLQPQQASGKLYTEASTLTDPSNLSTGRQHDYLLVMFEQQVCHACDELHQDILKRKPVMQSLAGFDTVVLDVWSPDQLITPDGRQMPARNWASELGIHYSPSMLFFNRDGQEVFRTEAYLKSFHTKAALDYVASGSYQSTPEFQRYVQKIADDLHARGIEFDLMD